MDTKYNPTTGEQTMLGNPNNRMAELDRIAKSNNGGGLAVLPDHMQPPGVPTSAAELSGLTSDEQANAEKTARWKINELSDKLKNSSNGSERQILANEISQHHAKYANVFGFAEGGKVESAEQLLARMNAKYGVSNTSSPTPQPAAPRLQANTPAQQLQPGGTIQRAAGLLGGRAQQIDKAIAGYAKGGELTDDQLAEISVGEVDSRRMRRHRQRQRAEIESNIARLGGKIQGPGTSTSDSITAQVQDTGEQIKVSTGERILSKKQDDLLLRIAKAMGFTSVDQLLEVGTGQPVGPTMKHGKKAAANGAEIGGNGIPVIDGVRYQDMNAERTGLVDGIRGDMRRYADRVKMLDDARSANEKTKSVPTRYAMDAKRIDQGSATEYWTTPYEMAARAFSAYVEDKISEESGRSDFLSYGSNNSMPQYRIFNVRPFPEGAERAAINQGFDQLFETLQTRETEKGVQLFNQTGRTKKATSLDRDVFGLAAAGSPSARILSSIAEASNDPYRRELAKLLQAKGIAPAVTVSDGDGQHAAAYDPRSNTVALFAEADAERHFLHEAIHAATLSALNNKGLVAGQMKALHKHVVEQLGADSHYGMSNLDEFVAEAFTNARFQAELRRLPAAPGSTLASSWHWFVRTVRQLLGLDAKHDSALSQALQLGVSLMDEVSNRTAVDRSAHGAELKALRRAAARLERPEDGITFRVTDDGLAIAIGPKGKIVPPRFAKFARENGLTYQVRRLPVAAGTEAPAMPETYRESGAKYFGELASDNRPIDRTGKTRFNVQRLAPNGKPSNLNEKQWHQVRTLAFKAWFGDWQNDPAKASQVVDENGEPLVVYHGTTNGGMFTEFKPNDRGLIWAASQRETAASYAGSDREVDLGGKERQRGVLPVFLNIRNPSEIKADGKSYVDLTQFDGEDFTDWFAMQAKKAGRDGAIIRDVIDDGGEGAHEIKTAGDNYVVFGSAQVKSAMQNVGSFDLSNPDVRFSATDERLTVRDWLTHQLANQRSWALGALTRDQLADIYGREMPEVAEFDRVVQQMDQARNIVAEQADALVERWRKLPGKVADTLADLMHTATLEQFDPDLKTRDDVHTPEQSMLLKEWGNLSPEAQQLYRDVREQYRATLVKLRNGLAKRAETQSAAAIRLEFDKYLAEGPYFPLARFGDFILIAAKFGQRIVEAFESSASREKRARGLRAQGWTTKLTAKKDYSAASDGPSGEFVGKVLVLVGGMDIETKEKSALMDSLNQLAISALPDQSYRRHFSHRKGTPGFSQDAMRAFASSMQHVSHHVARVLHGDELQILVDGLNKRTKEATGDVDTTAMQQVANELAKRLDLMLNPTTHPVTAALGQVGFVMSLGGSVASGLTNLSQTPLVTYPWLGARFGFGKAAAALTRASKDYFAGRWDRWSGFVLKDSNSLSADERSALTELEDAGLINLTQAHDLAGTANTDSANSSRSFAINRAMKLVGWTFHVPEVMNRQVSALAAYRLARDKGQDHQAAIETAREAVRATHFDYSGSNRARWMAGNFTRTVTMFKQYSQNVTYLLWRQTYQALKGESPEVRREARRMLLGVAATHFAAAGTLGLPLGVFGVTPLLGLLAMGMGSEDEPWDWQVEFRNLLADLFGKQAGEAIAHGPLRTLTGIDMAGRVGLGDLWIRAPLAEKEGRDLVEAWMLTLLGPVAGYAGNIGTAMKAFDEGKVGRGFEAMLPKFIAAPIKAARYESDGVKSWRGDDLGVQLDGGDIFATALGFQPSQLAQMFEGQRAIKGRESQLMARREEISNMFTSAALAGDSEMQAESMKAAMAFSLRNPSMALTADSLRRSLQAKVRNQAMIKDGVYLSKKRQDLRAEGRFAVTD